MNRTTAETLATRALAHLAEDTDRFSRFSAITGIDPSDTATMARDPAFLLGVVEYLMQHETALLDCAADLGIEPEAFGSAAAALDDHRPSW